MLSLGVGAELDDGTEHRVPSQARATTRSTIWLVIAQASSLLIGFVVWAYVARVLRPEQFGEVQLGIAVGTYLALLATVGLNPLAIAEFASKRRRAAYVVRLQSIRVVHTVVVLSGVVVAGLLIPSHTVSVLLVLCASSVVLRQLWPEWADIALDASRRVALIRTVYYVSVLAGTLLLVRRASDATEFGLVLSLGTLVAAVPAWCLTAAHLRRLGHPPTLVPAASANKWGLDWRQTMRRALPLGAGDVLGQLLANADILLLGALASKESVALYGAAYRIILAVQGVGVALRYASLRVLASPGARRNQRKPSKFEDDLVLLIVLGAVVIAAAAALTAPLAISLSYGSQYAGSVELLRVLVWTWPLDFSSAVVLNMLIVRGRRRRYVAAMSLAAAVNLAANAFVIPRFGAGGAAVVIVVSLAVLLLGALWMMDVSYLVERRRGFWLPLALVAAGLAGSMLIGGSKVLGASLLGGVGAMAAYKLLRMLKPGLARGVRTSVVSS
jgi:O-antigen/teichoic acid export membrane protein